MDMLREFDARLGTMLRDDGEITGLQIKEIISENLQTFRGNHYRALSATRKFTRQTLSIWAIWLTVGQYTGAGLRHFLTCISGIGYPLYFDFLLIPNH